MEIFVVTDIYEAGANARFDQIVAYNEEGSES